MRVVVPYVQLHPRTAATLPAAAVRIQLGKDPLAYSRLLCEWWAKGESFLVVEQDVEFTARAWRQAKHCSCEWGVSPYAGAGRGTFTNSLGFTRFRGSLLRRLPDLAQRAAAIDDCGSVCPPGDWRMLDARMNSVLRGAGLTPHQHVQVPHHHVYDYGCACGAEGGHQ